MPSYSLAKGTVEIPSGYQDKIKDIEQSIQITLITHGVITSF